MTTQPLEMTISLKPLCRSALPINLQGEFRLHTEFGRCAIIGSGMYIPCKSAADARRQLQSLQRIYKEQGGQ